MAGESEIFNQEINRWIIDYICSISWKDFNETKQITDGKRDLIQGMLYMVGNENLCQEKPLFMVVLCRLADGEECDTRYSETSDVTVLEDLLLRFETLVKMQTKELKAEGLELLPVIKAEAVMVCCRDNEFALGQEVCNRLWPKRDRKDKILENMRDLLQHGKTDHAYLKDYKYNDFLNTMLKYLDKVQQHFKAPLLFEAARSLLEGSNIQVDSQNRTSVDHSNNASSGKHLSHNSLEKAAEKKAEKVHSPERQNKKLWSTNIKKAFGGPAELNGVDSTTDKQGSAFEDKTPNKKRVLPDSQTPSRSTKKTPAKQRKVVQDEEPDQEEPGPSRIPQSPASKQAVSPARYRKNIDREDRHEPVKGTSSSEISDVSDDDDSSICTVSIPKHRKVWSQEEMEDFYDAVKVFGVGKWAEIRDHLGTSRSSVQLKDKWRTMLKRGDVQELKKKRKR